MSEVQRVVLIPRYSAFVANMTYKSQPINVRPYSSIEIIAWRSSGIGTIDASALTIEESSDLVNWSSVGSLGLTSTTETTADMELELPWIRCSILATGSGSPFKGAFSCWAVGNLALRRS